MIYFFFLLMGIMVVWILYYGYHFLIAIAVHVHFPVTDAQHLFWMLVVMGFLYLFLKLISRE